MRWRFYGVALGVAACSAVSAPLAPLPPSVPDGRPAPAAIAAQPIAPTTEPTAAPEVVAPPAAAAEPAPLPRVIVEPAYSALGHPRLATEMLTLGRDEELFQWALGGSSDPAHPANQPGYHPATRVVVDVQLLSRAPKGSATRLERIARSIGYWPLRSCFEAAQRLSPKSERSARVRLTLGASGKVLGSRSLGAARERDYARCVLERARALDFTPGFTRKLDVEISLRQWPGNAPVPPRAPDDAPVLRLPPEAAASFESLTPTLSACYEKGLSGDAKLWGRIAFKLDLADDGAVAAATPVETRFPNADVVECARQTLLGARLVSVNVKQLTFAVRLSQGAPPAPAAAAGLPPAPGSGEPPAPH